MEVRAHLPHSTRVRCCCRRVRARKPVSGGEHESCSERQGSVLICSVLCLVVLVVEEFAASWSRDGRPEAANFDILTSLAHCTAASA